MEPRLGHDLSDVRIHRNSTASDIAEGLQARAATIGNHIIFGEGQFPAGNERGSKLLTHEVVHTLQQSQDSFPLVQRAPLVSDDELEGQGIEDSYPLDLKDEAVTSTDLTKAPRDLTKAIDVYDRDAEFFVFDVLLPEIRNGLPANEEHLGLETEQRFELWRQQGGRIRQKLDAQSIARWLRLLKRALRFAREPLIKLAEKPGSDTDLIRYLNQERFRYVQKAKELEQHPFIKLGNTLVDSETSSTNRRYAKRGLGKGLVALGQASESDLRAARAFAVEELSMDLDPAQEVYLRNEIRILDEQLGEAKYIEERKYRGSTEPTFAQLEDRLTTIEIELQRDRGGSAALLKRMDISGLAKLAENPKARVRLASLGLQLSESTIGQSIGGLIGSISPVVLGNPGDIVTGRFDEEQAILKISRAVAFTGNAVETISVADQELTQLKIVSSGGFIFVRKRGILPGVAAFNAAMANIETPRTDYTFAPSDTVKLVWNDSDGNQRSLKIAAFALLYMEDKRTNDMYQTWAQLIELGRALAPRPRRLPNIETVDVPKPAIVKGEAIVTKPTANGHEIVVTPSGVGVCSPTPCPVIHVEYKNELDAVPELKQWNERIQAMPKTQPKEAEAAAAEADALVRTLEAHRRNVRRRPASSPDEVDAAFDELQIEGAGNTGLEPKIGREYDPTQNYKNVTSSHIKEGRQIFGKTIGASPDLKRLWNEAFEASETAKREMEKVKALVESGNLQAASELAANAYDRVRRGFWRRVRKELPERFEKAGMKLSKAGGPYYERLDGRRDVLTLDHWRRKSESPLLAVDPDNLVFSPFEENSIFLEFIRNMDPFQKH